MGRSLYHHQRSSAAVFRGTTTESQRNVFRRSEACAREAGTVCEGSPSQPHKDANRPMNVLLVGIMAVFIALSPAWAQGDQTGVPWSQLSPGEQQLLQRFSDNWDQLPPRKQQRLRNGARQWGTMTPEERQEAKQRFKEWRSLPRSNGSNCVSGINSSANCRLNGANRCGTPGDGSGLFLRSNGRSCGKSFRQCPRRNVVPIGGSFAASMAAVAAGRRLLELPVSNLPASP